MRQVSAHTSLMPGKYRHVLATLVLCASLPTYASSELPAGPDNTANGQTPEPTPIYFPAGYQAITHTPVAACDYSIAPTSRTFDGRSVPPRQYGLPAGRNL